MISGYHGDLNAAFGFHSTGVTNFHGTGDHAVLLQSSAEQTVRGDAVRFHRRGDTPGV
jgi:hypothetical protein